MKKIMMIAAMMLMSIGAFAQNEVGQITLKPTVGMNIATVTKQTDSKVRVGMMAGVEGEYGVAENFGLTAGLFYSMQGVKFTNKIDGVDLTETDKVDFLNIPIMANYYVIPGLAVKAGIQPGFKVSGKRSIDAKEGSSKANLTEDLEGIKAFQFAIPVGASYEYKSFVLDARYNIYLTKAAKVGDGRHSVFTISLGYKFAL